MVLTDALFPGLHGVDQRSVGPWGQNGNEDRGNLVDRKVEMKIISAMKFLLQRVLRFASPLLLVFVIATA